jgi:N-acylneuraminate cytidylyltransferase/CMP-N,N'-diacetyllegionaminic acid synthase
MIGGRSVLVLVTARGGSKGVPKKNVRPLLGKPLIAWTIEAAKQSRYVDRVLVSTDSLEIKAVAEQAGADVPFLRPAGLADDLAKQEDAILHAMDWCETNDKAYDYMMVLVPTTPLRDTKEIDATLEMLFQHERAKAIFTVRECDHSPLQANILPSDACMDAFVPEHLKLKNRQELPTYYQLSGSVCLSEWGWFREQKSFLTPKTFAYLTDARRGLDIDSVRDFLLAEVYLRYPEIC